MADFTHCPGCELSFKAFRSGDTFSAVSKELYPDLPPAEWLKPYTRKTVLSTLKKRKRIAWERHMDACGDSMPEPEEPAHVMMAKAADKWANARWVCDECGRGSVDSPHTMSIAICDECIGGPC